MSNIVSTMPEYETLFKDTAGGWKTVAENLDILNGLIDEYNKKMADINSGKVAEVVGATVQSLQTSYGTVAQLKAEKESSIRLASYVKADEGDYTYQSGNKRQFIDMFLEQKFAGKGLDARSLQDYIIRVQNDADILGDLTNDYTLAYAQLANSFGLYSSGIDEINDYLLSAINEGVGVDEKLNQALENYEYTYDAKETSLFDTLIRSILPVEYYDLSQGALSGMQKRFHEMFAGLADKTIGKILTPEEFNKIINEFKADFEIYLRSPETKMSAESSFLTDTILGLLGITEDTDGSVSTFVSKVMNEKMGDALLGGLASLDRAGLTEYAKTSIKEMFGSENWIQDMDYLIDEAVILGYRFKDAIKVIGGDAGGKTLSSLFGFVGEDGWSDAERNALGDMISMMEKGTISLIDFNKLAALGEQEGGAAAFVANMTLLKNGADGAATAIQTVTDALYDAERAASLEEAKENGYLTQFEALKEAAENAKTNAFSDVAKIFQGFGTDMFGDMLNTPGFLELFLSFLGKDIDSEGFIGGIQNIINEIKARLQEEAVKAVDYDTSSGLFETLLGFRKDMKDKKPITDMFSPQDFIDFPKIREALTAGGDLPAAIEASIGDARKALEASLIELFRTADVEESQIGALVKSIIDGIIFSVEEGAEKVKDVWKEFLAEIKGESLMGDAETSWEETGMSDYRSYFMDKLRGGDQKGTEFLSAVQKMQGAKEGSIANVNFSTLTSNWTEFLDVVSKLERGLIDADEAFRILDKSSKKIDFDRAIGEAADDFKALGKGGTSAIKVIDNISKKSKSMTKAMSAMNFVQKKQYKDQDELNEAYAAMGEYLGISIEDSNDFIMAQGMMTGAIAETGLYLDGLVNAMYELDAVGIDPSGKVVAIGNIEEAAKKAGMSVEAFRAWLASINGAGFNYTVTGDEKGAKGTVKSWLGKQGIPAFTPSGTKKGGGGGGGGGNETSEIQKFLDKLSQQKDIDDFLRKMVQLRGNLYEARGELTNYIQAVEQEIDVVTKRNKVDEEELQQIDERMMAQQALVASLSTSDKKYEQASSDLKSLQETHQQYTETVEQNKIELEELNDTLEETRNAIRDMQIDLRETIHEAIMDREELNDSMLENEVAMQEEVLAVIEERYQREWDLIKENIDAQKEALEEEKRLIDEELNARKDAAKKADRYAELRGYESQLAIISADPTRAKDQLELRKKIADIREEIAWDLAEVEAEAQKDSVDQQISSLDDYLTKMNEFYEALFENPQQMYQEMVEIFKASDAELVEWATANVEGFAQMTEEQQKQTINTIHQLMYATNGEVVNWMSEHVIGFTSLNETEQERLMTSVRTMVKDSNEYVVTWLEQNNREFQTSTDAQKETMSNGWRDTMIAMRGATVTYWDEVEQIISQGDDAIIAFLKANSEDYRLAGKMQAEALVDEWQKKLDDLKAALTNTYQKINDMPTDKYVTIHVSTVESGGGGGKTPIDPGVVKVGGGGNFTIPGKTTEKLFASGGLVDYTGTAQVHGSPTRPEAFLSANDTSMMRKFLDMAKMFIGVPGMPSIKSSDYAGSEGGVTIEQILIEVDRLDNDTDLERLANKVGEKFAKAITTKRGTSIGNLRIK